MLIASSHFGFKPSNFKLIRTEFTLRMILYDIKIRVRHMQDIQYVMTD